MNLDVNASKLTANDGMVYAVGDITITDADVTASSATQGFSKSGKIVPAEGKAMRVDQGEAQA